MKVRRSKPELSVLMRKVERARLRSRAVLEVRITKCRRVGFMRRHTVRGGTENPRIQDFCLPAGGGRPKRC